LGTQKIESYLRRRYPSARIARADADTTRGKHDWATLYTQMAVGELDILVGTQMISKGHDFPRLTLVGVVGADDALYSADFRAPERLFAQLTQVAGRAGRADLPGEVLIQSDLPDHPVLRALVTDDFTAFARRELAERESAQLPPSHALALVRVEGVESTACERILRHCERVLAAHPLVTTFPPVPSPLARRAARFRWQMMLTSSSRAALRAALHALPLPQNAASLHCSIDVDPIDLT
jgi:primosomal protein N' (replication factor Y)